MRATMLAAKQRGVAIGAHPGFDDRENFGRQEMRGQLATRSFALVAYQLGAFAAVAKSLGMRPQHVKPHGALYNMAARDEADGRCDRARRSVAVDRARWSSSRPPPVRCRARRKRTSCRSRAKSSLIAITCRTARLFRAIIRRRLLHDPEQAANRVFRMLRDDKVEAIDGTRCRRARRYDLCAWRHAARGRVCARAAHLPRTNRRHHRPAARNRMSIARTLADDTAEPGGLERGLGQLDATMIVVGSMIGSGIFITSAESARLVGAPGWLLMAWVLAGLLTITGALCCAELAAMMPTRRRPIRLPARSLRPGLRFPFWLGGVPRHPDRHDRRRRGGVRAVHRRVWSRRSRRAITSSRRSISAADTRSASRPSSSSPWR